MDPSTQALQAEGAAPAEPYTFRMLSVDYKTERHSAGRQIRAWTLPDDVTDVLGLDWVKMQIDRRRGKPQVCTQRRQRLGMHQ